MLSKLRVNFGAFCLLCGRLLVHFLVGFLLVIGRFRVINWLTLAPLRIVSSYLRLIEVSVLAQRPLMAILQNAVGI